MRFIGCFMIVFYLLGCTSVNIGADPIQSKPTRTFILAQIDSIALPDSKVLFTAIRPYTTLEFNPTIIDNDTAEVKSEFYDSLVLNRFGEGKVETPIQLKKIKRNGLYLLEIDILKSDKEMLVIQAFVKPNELRFSKMTKLDHYP